MKIFITFLLLLNLSMAEELTAAKVAQLVKKGEKISLTLCEEEKLLSIEGEEIEVLLKNIEAKSPCGKLSSKNAKALAYFLIQTKSSVTSPTQIEVPKEAKCPVCGMFVEKYPKWSALVMIEGKIFYFDGVKDMMKYYIFDSNFPYDREKIEEMAVTNFYTLSAIPAKEAFYVIGSDVYGPMGNELIPFTSKKEAENFMKDHKGEKLVEFKEITGKMVMALDGIEY